MKNRLICILTSICTVFLFSPAYAAVLFQDNFDNHADWSPQQTTQDQSCYSGCNMSGGWTAFRNGLTYCPGGPGYNNIYIDDENANGGTGKAATFYDESCVSSFEDSDGILGVDLGADYDELYVKFMYRVQPGYQIMNVSGETTAQHKLIGIQHYSSGNPFSYFTSNPGNQPLSSSGWSVYRTEFDWYVENRCQGTYYCRGINVASLGTVSSNRSKGLLDGNWHEIIVRQKRNSAIGTANGVYQVWIDGTLKMSLTDIQWNDSGSAELRGWRFVRLGGNNNNRWTTSCSGTSCEQWYALDDVVISTTAITPGSPVDDSLTAPKNLRIQ